ncbi:MAG: hypothetical protein FWH22_07205 [Fibromonadales bacterium]|nr:hypothetical protein [Fibromonadales bacterium]
MTTAEEFDRRIQLLFESFERFKAEDERHWAEERQRRAVREAEEKKRTEEFDRKMREIGERIGGIGNNVGHHAEQFFQNAFREKLKFGHVKYDEMIPNLKYRGKTDKVEFDIALVNGDSVALIEVKNRIHPSAVKELAEEKIEKFKKYFPEFQGYAAYLGIAGFSFSDEVVDRASTYGIGIIGQKGDSVELKGELKAY